MPLDISLGPDLMCLEKCPMRLLAATVQKNGHKYKRIINAQNKYQMHIICFSTVIIIRWLSKVIQAFFCFQLFFWTIKGEAGGIEEGRLGGGEQRIVADTATQTAGRTQASQHRPGIPSLSTLVPAVTLPCPDDR